MAWCTNSIASIDSTKTIKYLVFHSCVFHQVTTEKPHLEGSQEKEAENYSTVHLANPAMYSLKHSPSDCFEIDSTTRKIRNKDPMIMTDGNYYVLASPLLTQEYRLTIG